MSFLLLFLLITVFLLTRTTRILTAVNVFCAQSLIVAVACLLAAFEGGALHIYIAALLTLLIKAVGIPVIMWRACGKNVKEDHPLLSVNYTSLAFGASLVIAYAAVGRFMPDMLNRDALAVAVALVLMGVIFVVVRRQALMQLIGMMTMENGLYLLGLSATKGLPVIIEFGIFLDVLFVAVIIGFLTRKIHVSFATTDTSELAGLKDE